jgi:hypothetical protein
MGLPRKSEPKSEPNFLRSWLGSKALSNHRIHPLLKMLPKLKTSCKVSNNQGISYRADELNEP